MTETKQVCHEYILYEKYTDYYYWITSFIIILYNYCFYMTTLPIISCVGFHLRTYQYRLVTMIIFICLIIDTIALPLLTGANFIEYNDKQGMDKVFTGKHTDFGDEWYLDVGYQYVTTMVVFIINPFIDFLTEYIEVSIHRCYARKYVYKKRSSAEDKHDFLKYLDVSAGPEYCFHSKLANTALLLFFTITFGPILPILYPIGLASALVQYLTDKLFLSYFYRLPPKYSEELTLQIIETMMFAPLISLLVSYWAFGNRQMFENKIDPVQTFNQLTYSHHTLMRSGSMPDYAHLKWIEIAIYIEAAVILFYFGRDYVIKNYWKLQVRKTLPNYFESLKIQDCEDVVEDEEYFRLEGGFSVISDTALARLRCRIEEYTRNKELAKSSVKGAFDRGRKGGAPMNRGSARPINFAEDLEMRSQQGADDSNFIGDKYQFTMAGNPVYQVYKSVDFQLQFNNQNLDDENNTKLLLMMPMVPPVKHSSVKLNHLNIDEK